MGVVGAVAGVAGPPPLDRFQPLGPLVAGAQAGAAPYVLHERW